MVRIAKAFEFGSKGQTLERLKGRLVTASIPRFIFFSVAEWLADSKGIELQIKQIAGTDGDVIVRSSATNEDGKLFAQAGAFLSVPHVDPRNREKLIKSIENVISSYREGHLQSDSFQGDQVIVQRMVRDVSMSGVVFTQDLSSGAPYYVINYDDETGSTESVTSGNGYANRTIYIYRDAWCEVASERFLRLLEAVREIEALTEDGCLDIEFAMDSDMNVHILQVRRITTQPNWNRSLGIRIGDTLTRLKTSVGPRLIFSKNRKEPGTVLGKMPDWNPAEIIGNSPRRLAFSIYRYMITDFAWRQARAAMGYREPRGLPLMWSCAGQPYIDVRQSFQSYLPANLDALLADRIVDHWIWTLAENPHLHDKVEFDVAITSWTFDFSARAERFLPQDLSSADVKKVESAFRELTAQHLEAQRASIDEQEAAIKELQRRHAKVVGEGELVPDITLAARLLEDAIEFGTIPFSVLARHGFIARTLLDSLVTEGVLKAGEVDAFFQGVTTVAGEFIEDIDRCANGDCSSEFMISRYGHLRPGTYDILSWRYDQRGERFLSGSRGAADISSSNENFRLSGEQSREIAQRLYDARIDISPSQLMEYCAKAIQGREWAKFVFTRSISDSLEIIAAWGQRMGLSREELSHIDVRHILDCLVETKGRSLEYHLRTLSNGNRAEYEVTAATRLPYLLVRPSDLVIVPMLLDEPNYVTLKSVRADCVHLTGRDINPEVLDGKIVVIESADPGFDWIFTRDILGLITKFGGANSHMAIRCAEFDLPAAIGCGEQIYERVVRCEYIELDCSVGKIEPVLH
ncbi:MAG: PEP-utilizing enzyme [Pseudomonadota bacterium]